MINRIAVAIGVLVQALWVAEISEERIKSVETTNSRVVISRTQVVVTITSVELFAAVEELRQSVGRVEADGIAKGIIREALRDGVVGGNVAQSVCEGTGITVAVVEEVFRVCLQRLQDAVQIRRCRLRVVLVAEDFIRF